MLISKYTPRPDRRPAVGLILTLSLIACAGAVPLPGGDAWRSVRGAVSAMAALAALMIAARFAVYTVSYMVTVGERGAELLVVDERRGILSDAMYIEGGELREYSKKLVRELRRQGIAMADRRVDLIPAHSAIFIPRTAADAAEGRLLNARREERVALRFQPSDEQVRIIRELCGRDAADSGILEKN